MNKRSFFKAAAPLVVRSRIFAANDRIGLGFIGLGGRARWLITNEEYPGAEIAAVADCFLPRCHEAAKLREAGARWGKYQEYRRMFEKEKLDAVFVETTTYTRALVAIHALQAGLDVYAEKTPTLTVAEGRKLVREGAIGKVHTVIACNFTGPTRWTPKPEQPMPEGLDWDQWCNQTELRPYHKDLHTRWALWWDYDGGGQSWGVSGWGTHSLDQVQCALGTDETGPVEIWPEESGPECKVTLRYASGTLLKLEEPIKKDHSQLGAIFVGEKGAIQILRGTYVAVPEDLLKGAPEATPEGPGEDRYHIENFLECIRTRKRPNADVEIGHRATTVCHLVNICREVGRKLRWDPKAEQFLGDEEANKLLARPRRKGYELPAV